MFLFSSSAANSFTRDFVCSVVVGRDLVPRLSMINLIKLKVKILKALIQCDFPKVINLSVMSINIKESDYLSGTAMNSQVAPPRSID